MLIEPPLGELFSRIVINEEALTFQISTDTNASIRKHSRHQEKHYFQQCSLKQEIYRQRKRMIKVKILKNLHANQRDSEEKGFNVLYLICDLLRETFK